MFFLHGIVHRGIMIYIHILYMELDLQSLFGLHVHSCTHWLRPRNPPPRIWAHIRGRYWSAKIDISLSPPAVYIGPSFLSFSTPASFPPLSSQQIVSLSASTCCSSVQITDGRGGRGQAWNRIIRLRPQESLDLCKPFNPLWYDGTSKGGKRGGGGW
jgi:hypothetical protein